MRINPEARLRVRHRRARRLVRREINTEVQTAAILRGGAITYYDAAGELRATGARSDFARQWDLWKHDSCVKAAFCKPEFEGRMAPQGGGRGGRGAGRGAEGGRGAGGVGVFPLEAAQRARQIHTLGSVELDAEGMVRVGRRCRTEQRHGHHNTGNFTLIDASP